LRETSFPFCQAQPEVAFSKDAPLWPWAPAPRLSPKIAAGCPPSLPHGDFFVLRPWFSLFREAHIGENGLSGRRLGRLLASRAAGPPRLGAGAGGKARVCLADLNLSDLKYTQLTVIII
jgi:hypothetical protein